MNRQELLKLIRNTLGKYYSYPRVNKQLNSYIENGHSLDEIAGCFKYFYEVQNGDPSRSNGGIAILDYIFSEYHVWQEEQSKKLEVTRQMQEDIEKYKPAVSKKVTISRVPIEKPKRLHLFNLD